MMNKRCALIVVLILMLNSHAPEGTTINETKGSERKREVVE